MFSEVYELSRFLSTYHASHFLPPLLPQHVFERLIPFRRRRISHHTKQRRS